MGISCWAEMEGDDNRFSSGIPKDNKRLERSDNKPHSEEQAAMETRKRRRDAAEHFAKNFSILDALRSNLPEVFAAEILPKFDLLSTLSLAQVNKTVQGRGVERGRGVFVGAEDQSSRPCVNGEGQEEWGYARGRDQRNELLEH